MKISRRSKTLFIVAIIVGFLFVAHRANQYIHDRKNKNHDTYMVVKGGEYQKCPDMDMFGFKYSVILILLSIILLLNIIVVMN